MEKDKASKEQDLSKIINEQKLRIENMLTDMDCNEWTTKQTISTLTNKLETNRWEKQTMEMELQSLRDRSEFEVQSVDERGKLALDRLEQSYKF